MIYKLRALMSILYMGLKIIGMLGGSAIVVGLVYKFFTN